MSFSKHGAPFQPVAFQLFQEFWVLTEIIDRFEAVLEASPFTLKHSREPFSFDRQPNGLLGNAYRIEDRGLRSSRSATNAIAVRIDNLRVWIAGKLAFNGQTAVETIEDRLVDLERYLKADGKAYGYHVEFSGRDVRRLGDLVIAAIDLSVDYDFSESV